jgi:DNA-binding Lrp family transcriptional regulator
MIVMSSFESTNWLLDHMLATKRIDQTDYKILTSLVKDARQSTQAISDYAGVSRATAHERIKKLLEKKMIMQFLPKFDYSKAGLALKAYILVGYDAQIAGGEFTQDLVAKKISKINYVNSVSIITGQYDFLVDINIDHMNNLADIIIGEMRKIKGVSQTMTLLQFDEYIDGLRQPRPKSNE